MQRIVHGHHANPNSTRDIVNISPDQFETIISSLQTFHKSMEAIMASRPEDRKLLLEMIVKSELVDISDMTAEEMEEKLKNSEEKMLTNYRNSYDILVAINQPYIDDISEGEPGH